MPGELVMKDQGKAEKEVEGEGMEGLVEVASRLVMVLTTLKRDGERFCMLDASKNRVHMEENVKAAEMATMDLALIGSESKFSP